MIIALSGRIGSGKNTVAKYLIEKYDFVEESFAKPVKDCISSIFQWDRDMLEGLNEEHRKARETEDRWWSERLQIEGFSPRKSMLIFATDIIRRNFNENIWVFSLEKRLLNREHENIVVTDCRFQNEMEFLKSKNSVSVLVERNREDWYEIALEAKKGNRESLRKLENSGIHISEWDLIDYKFDYTIINDGSLDSLFKKVDLLIEKIKEGCQKNNISI